MADTKSDRQPDSLPLDPEDRAATWAGWMARVRKAAEEGDDVAMSKWMRLAHQTDAFIVKTAAIKTETDPPPANDNTPPRPPLKLRPEQKPPETLPDGSDWRTWLFMGGRGAGKTLAGAEWLADQAMALDHGRVALIGPTLHDVREVMIEGVSGILNLPRWTDENRPVYEPSRRRLVFKNHCVAHVFSAEDPDSLRGPQYSAAWADEFCAWPAVGPRGASETLAMVRMGLRLPGPPRKAAEDGVSSPSPDGEGDHPEPEGRRMVEGLGEASPSARPGECRDPDGARDSGSSLLDSLSNNPACDLDPGIRRGERMEDAASNNTPPKLAVTTTPRPTRALIALRDEASCVTTHAGTADNAANLSAGFLDHLKSLYGGTRHEAQELDGQVVALDGALFTAEMMLKARQNSPSPGGGGWSAPPGDDRVGAARRYVSDGPAEPSPPGRFAACPPPPGEGKGPASPPFHRVVVAVDPCATAHGDACGIVVAGSRTRADGVIEAVVLADLSARGLSPDAWARRAATAAETFKANAIVAEVNQGGDMVETVLRTAGYTGPVRSVRASRGKAIRAEPVAALYEQGRVRHAGRFRELEEELMAVGVEDGSASLDRADALVWAVTDLLVDRPGERGPRLWWG